MEIAVVAGEASGDRHASELIKALWADPGFAAAGISSSSIRFWGIGGVEMKALGVELIRDSRFWGSIGVVESFKNASQIIPALREMKRRLLKNPPSALILVDFGAFNIALGLWVKQNAICPVLYFMPPGSWRRKPSPGRLARLTACSDFVVTPFPWSAEQIEQAGGRVSFVGHPLLDLVKSTKESSDMDDLLGLDPSKTVITLLPGSRVHEVKSILPVMFDAAGLIAQRLQSAQFIVALAPNMDRDVVIGILEKQQRSGGASQLLQLMQQAPEKILHAAGISQKRRRFARTPVLATNEGMVVDAKRAEDLARFRAKCVRPSASQTASLAIAQGMTYDAISRSDYVIAASGTATLETAILNRPMVIVYRGSKLMELEWRIRKKALDIEYIGLPNILAGRMLCPELIQEQATPEAIAGHAVDMLVQPERVFEAKKELASVVKTQLGEPGASVRTAHLFAAEILKGERKH